MHYEDERFCDHCDRYTQHRCKDSGHERDSSWNYQECLMCHWYKYGINDEYQPPNPSENYMIAKSLNQYNEAWKHCHEPLPRKSLWDWFWGIPGVDIYLLILLVLCWSAFVVWMRL